MDWLTRQGLQVRVLNLGVPDEYVEHMRVEEQLEQCGLSALGIAARVLEALG